jgi:hypothetical protein
MIFVFSQVFPMINRSSNALVSMSDDMNDRMQTRINVINAAASSDKKTIYIWVKNVGESRIADIGQSDLFLGEEKNFGRIPYTDNANGLNPLWQFEIENDTEWKTSATIKITVTYDEDPGTGTYFVKLVLPNGIDAEYYFSM